MESAPASIAPTPTRCDEYFPQRSRAKPPLNEVPIPKELRRDHGFVALPKKFNNLVTLFNEMEKILQTSYGREQRKTFAELAANVEKNCKKKFTEKHLAQIAAVYPAAYSLRWERPRERRAVQLGLWDLVVHPNLHGNKDLAPFIDDYLNSFGSAKSSEEGEKSPSKPGGDGRRSPNWTLPSAPANGQQQCSPMKRGASDLPLSPVKLISPLKSARRHQQDCIFRSPQKPKTTIAYCAPILDGRPKMDANRLKWRKMVFRHLLVSRVRQAHANFLEENKLKFEAGQQGGLHERFKAALEEAVPDIQTDGAIPLRRKLNNSPSRHLQATDIRTFLESVKAKGSAAERERTPERNPPPPPTVCKSEPNTPQTAAKANPSLKFEPMTPKTPLEERLKAKFAANDAARKAGLPEMQRRRTQLHKLEGGILEVLRAHLNLEQRYSVALNDRVLLQKLGREVGGAALLEHLRLLCELMPVPAKGEAKLCWLESLGGPKAGPGSHFFKISREAGPNWAEEAGKAVRRELAALEGRMHTLHRSPSSCF